MPDKILVVDDEPAIQQALGFALSKAGIAYELADDAEEAERRIEQSDISLVVLDWMLPGISGIDLVRRLKSSPGTATLPIIMLTARGEEDDTIRGLEVGADDYLVKPVSPRELIARIRAVLRRAGSQTAEVIQLGGLALDTISRRVYLMGSEVELSATEFELLRVLMASPDRVFSRAQLLDLAWPRGADVGERTVDVHVSSLRKTLEPLAAAKIQTVRGVGYRFSPRG